MFGLIYHLLPGPRWMRALVVALLVVALVVFLFGWGFEAMFDRLPGLFDGDVMNPGRELDSTGRGAGQ